MMVNISFNMGIVIGEVYYYCIYTIVYLLIISLSYVMNVFVRKMTL